MTGKVKGETFLKNIVQFEPIYCFLNKALGKHFEYIVLVSENWEELTKIWLYWLMQLKFLNKKSFGKKEIVFNCYQVARETTSQASLVIFAKN